MKPGTPLPWKRPADSEQAIEGPNGEDVGSTYQRIWPPVIGHTERVQNALYIAHAANLYPELVEALRGCKDLLIALDPGMADWEPNVIAARAILKRADA